jgi:hypothetical protein
MTVNHAPWITCLLALTLPTAYATEKPVIFGYLQNQSQGRILFTLTQNSCPKNSFFVFATEDGGKIGASGCYQLVGDELITTWDNEPDMYSYSFLDLTLSNETLRIVEKMRKKP